MATTLVLHVVVDIGSDVAADSGIDGIGCSTTVASGTSGTSDEHWRLVVIPDEVGMELLDGAGASSRRFACAV